LTHNGGFVPLPGKSRRMTLPVPLLRQEAFRRSFACAGGIECRTGDDVQPEFDTVSWETVAVRKTEIIMTA
jgi:hypothetical protein